MRRTHRIAATLTATLAGLAVASLAVAGPAAAHDAPAPVASEAVVGASAVDGLLATAAAGTADASSAKRGYRPGTRRADDGSWIAYIEDPSGFVELEVGRYETRKEARKAAKKAAEEANGVMDGPGCDPPIVLC